MNAIEDVRRRMPDAARDLSLNLASALSAAQRWGVTVASAIAAREPAPR